MATGILIFLVCHPTTRAAEVWLAGVDPFVRNVMQPGSQSDYLALFDDNAAWRTAAKRVKIFKTSTQYLNNAPDEDLRKMFRGLKHLNIGLGLEGLMIPREDACGASVEGFSAPSAIREAVERTRRLGGVITAVAMDEPLWFGHHYAGSNACKWSIDQVARAITKNVEAVREVFPMARIGDIEPIDLENSSAWAQEIMEFSAEYKKASGRTLDFVHVDIDWSKSWREPLLELAKRLRLARIPFGVIYNGDVDDFDDAWTLHAAKRFEMVESDPELSPDQGILQTWMIHPIHMLPESNAGTMTNLVLLYSRVPSKIDLIVKKDRLTAHLMDEKNRPLVNAAVSLYALDAGENPQLSTRHVNGVVPPGATNALIKLVVKNDCQCPHMVSVRMAYAVFRCTNRPDEMIAPPSNNLTSNRGGTVSYNLVNGEKVAVNSNMIDVHSDEQFDLTVPLGTSVGADASGYAALVFLDATGMEVRRRDIPLKQSQVELVSGYTNDFGELTYSAGASKSWASDWGATFNGDQIRRGSAVTIKSANPPRN